jgi:hypothetical protein
MGSQSLNTCHTVGVEFTSIVIGGMGLKYNQYSKECAIDYIRKIEEICIGENKQFFIGSFT